MRYLLAPPILLLASTLTAGGKGDTVKIVIRGEGLATPVELTDPAVVSRFQVLSGPGADRPDQPGLSSTGRKASPTRRKASACSKFRS